MKYIPLSLTRDESIYIPGLAVQKQTRILTDNDQDHCDLIFEQLGRNELNSYLVALWDQRTNHLVDLTFIVKIISTRFSIFKFNTVIVQFIYKKLPFILSKKVVCLSRNLLQSPD